MKLKILAAGFLCAALLGGCSLIPITGIPEGMEVRNGSTPGNVDDFVRFRTTLYFRTFDYCFNEALDAGTQNGDVRILPQTDSLYRFQLTGKAHSLTTKVRFESGTLKASEIDPFGATIVRDPVTNQPRFYSAGEHEREVRRKDVVSSVRELNQIRKELELDDEQDAAKQIQSAILAAIKRLLEDYPGAEEAKKKEAADPFADLMPKLAEVERALKALDGTKLAEALRSETAASFTFALVSLAARSNDRESAASEARTQSEAFLADLKQRIAAEAEAAEVSNKAASDAGKALLELLGIETKGAGDGDGVALTCRTGPARRGFQVLGPEGWRTFDQDERIILAMTSSADPLIETLQRTANNVLNARTSDADLLQLLQEDVRLRDAELILAGSTPASKAETSALFDAVAKAVAPKGASSTSTEGGE